MEYILSINLNGIIVNNNLVFDIYLFNFKRKGYIIKNYIIKSTTLNTINTANFYAIC